MSLALNSKVDVQYQNRWCPATVTRQPTGTDLAYHVQCDRSPAVDSNGTPVCNKGHALKFCSVIGSGPPVLKLHDRVYYTSRTNGNEYPGTVIVVFPDGGVKVQLDGIGPKECPPTELSRVRPLVMTQPSVFCDFCKEFISKNLRCQECDFDLCQKCVNSVPTLKAPLGKLKASVAGYAGDSKGSIALSPGPPPAPPPAPPRSEARRLTVQAFQVGSLKVVATNVENALVEAQEAMAQRNERQARRRDKRKTVSDLDATIKQLYNTLYDAASKDEAEFWTILKPRLNIERFDVNKDGKLSKCEFKTICDVLSKQLTLNAEDINKLSEELFARYDADESGYIEEREFAPIFYRLVKRLLALFTHLDTKHLTTTANTDRLYEQYILGKRLSQGAQGVTYMATKKGVENLKYVVKKPNAVEDLSDFESLRDKKNPNVVQVYELFTSSIETFIVMEFCQGGDLFGAVAHCYKTFGNLPMKFCAEAMEQTIRGVYYIHTEFRQCHNDIKPENILLDRKPTSILDVPRFMIADFGCASQLGEANNGDPRYNSPECWLGAPVSYKSDAWALGVTMYELLSGGFLPFTGTKNISGWASWFARDNGASLKRLKETVVIEDAEPDWTKFGNIKDDALTLCKGLLTWNYDKRLKLPEALNSQWFKRVNKDAFLDVNISSSLAERGNLSQWKMALLNMVASKLDGEHVEPFRIMWNQADTDKNGTLSQEEFVNMLVSKNISESVANDVFAVADVDASGNINFNEFTAVMFDPNAMSLEQLRNHCLSVFSTLRGGGELTAKEFVAAFPSGSESAIEDLFRKIDANDNGGISLQEFTEFLQLI